MASWLVLTLAAVALWGLWGFLAKVASDYLNPRSAAAIQGIGVVVVTLGILGFMRFKPEFHLGGALAAFLAGAALWIGIIAFVFALSQGGKASIVVPMTALYPVVTIGLSVAILKEQITPTTGLGIVFALIAVVLLSR